MDDVHGRAVTGGSFPADIWKGFMDKALADATAPPPDTDGSSPDERAASPSAQ